MARRRARRFRCALLALTASACAACSQCASEAEPAAGGGAPNTLVGADAVQLGKGLAQPSEASKPPSPPAGPLATPSVPPQLVACGKRKVHRITFNALQAFELAEQVPPPHIRGGSVARQVAQLEMEAPLNVLPLDDERVLVIANDHLLRHELRQNQSQRYVAISEPGPLFAWVDATSPEAFWVRSLDSEQLRRYALSSLAPADKKNAPSPPAKAAEMRSLPGFDARLFTLLADGKPLYSTQTGLLRLGSAASPAAFPELSATTLLFADASPSRYWAADGAGHLRLLDLDQGASPVASTRVPGVVVDVARDGNRVAVLSLELQGQSYRPSVTIFERGEQRGRVNIGPSIATGVQPQLDLCLIAGHPWVVVGSRHWLQLLDWSAPRLLAEW